MSDLVPAEGNEQIVAAVLVAHQRHGNAACLCGWSILGKSHPDHQARAVLAALAAADAPGPRIIETDAELQAAPDRIIVQAADGTVAARYDDERGVVFGDKRAFPWTALRAPAVVLREALG